MTARLPESEAGFQEAVLACAELHGWRLRYHTHNSKHSAAGFPDLVLIRAPELLVAELKRDGEKPTPAQQAWLDGTAACGIEAHVWRPADWDDIEARLQRRRHRRDSARIPAAYDDALAALYRSTERAAALTNGRADRYAAGLRDAFARLGIDIATDPEARRVMVGLLHELAGSVEAGIPAGVAVGQVMLGARVLTEARQ